MTTPAPEREPPDFPPPWASAWGDDHFGLWAEFTVSGVIQRMRWIEPGEFIAGSSAEERRRSGDLDRDTHSEYESPQHRVRLTKGFWLGETTCTQALWLVVVGGENPSQLKGEDRLPVESVSWDNVMERFMPRLASMLPSGVEAGLPTEAQWEYACRAGTDTAFSYGEWVSSDLVNVDGRNPYGDAPRSAWRQGTVPVGSLPANRWGLHEMHGNVWEWCADGVRAYKDVRPGEVAQDPIGPQAMGPLARRAVRGGSWFFDARYARSAHRGAAPRNGHSGFLSFRLLLRSTGRAGSGEAPEGPRGGESAAAPEATRPA